MALADTIFTIDGWSRLILAAFDLVLIFLASKVVLGLDNNEASDCQVNVHD
jgi:hypothetical protein